MSMNRCQAFFATTGVVALSLFAGVGASAQTNAGLIAYTSNANVNNGNPTGDHEIWVVRGDGTNKMQLTFNSVDDHAPDISLDGTKIVFLRDGLDSYNRTINQLWTMNSNGSNPQQINIYNVSPVLNLFDQPRWDPAGTRIAFGAKNVTSQYWASWTYYMANSGAIMTPNLSSRTFRDDVQPAWSPDGLRLAYVRRTYGIEDTFGNRTTLQDLYMTDPTALTTDGPKVVSLSSVRLNRTSSSSTLAPIQPWQPVFNRDGSKILFSITSGTTFGGMKLVNLNGTTAATYTTYNGFHPGFNADGSKIVASTAKYKDSTARGYGSIYTMNVNGSGAITVATGVEPSWGRLP